MDLEQAKVKFAHTGNEAAVLACVFRDGSNFFEVEARLTERDFLTPQHKAIWVIIKSLIQQDVAILDTSTILNQAITLELEDRISGVNVKAYDYISALFEKNVDSANIGFYIDRLLDASTKLQVLQIADEIAELTDKNRTLTGETLDAATIVDFAQDKFLQLSVDHERGTEATDLSEGITELLAEVAEAPTNVRGFPTGMTLLDEAINGLEPGTLTVLGARPKTGKSTMLLNWAKHIAYEYGQPVLYIDTEMRGKEQQFRLLSTLSGVEERQIKNGLYLSDERSVEAVNSAQKVMDSGIILHKYYPDFSPEGVSALVRKYHHQGRASCLFFDYIKLPDADLQKIMNVKEHQALGYLCVALKNLAGQLEIPVVTAAQIGREGANKGFVSSSNFADSDRILRYANTLLGLTAKTRKELVEIEEQYGREAFLNMGSHRLQILDTRAGGTNYDPGIDIYFRKKILTMFEADEQLFKIRQGGDEDDGFE